jgi:uncharacterized protein YndB with AHSA1/START domain
MQERSVTHGTFVIERSYDASPARVFAAWADPRAKAAWFLFPGGWKVSPHELELRVGGREHVVGTSPDGQAYTYDARYHDIVPDQRIVSTYDMHMGDVRLSVSLVTVELRPDGAATKLVYTEAGAFLDGHDTPEARIRGTEVLLDNLGAALQREARH